MFIFSSIILKNNIFLQQLLSLVSYSSSPLDPICHSGAWVLSAKADSSDLFQNFL